jgi:hypothetical protein
VRLPGKFKPGTGGDKARLVMKPTRITSAAMLTTHATTLIRAALRPEASKKIGCVAMAFDSAQTVAILGRAAGLAMARHGVALCGTRMAASRVHAKS